MAACDPDQKLTTRLVKRAGKGDTSAAAQLIALPPSTRRLAAKAKVLIDAAAAGHLEVVEMIFKSSRLLSADVNAALSEAAQNGHAAVVRALITAIDPEYQPAAIWLAAGKGHLAVVRMLLQSSKPSSVSMALTDAAAEGHIEVVDALLPLVGKELKDSVALRCAARNGHAAIVRLLIPESDPKIAHSEALRTAAANGFADIVEALIPVSGPESAIAEALRWAAVHGHTTSIRLLLPAIDHPSLLLDRNGHDFHPDAVKQIRAHLDALALANVVDTAPQSITRAKM